MLVRKAFLWMGLTVCPVAFAQASDYQPTRNYDPSKEISVEGVVDSFVYRDQARHRPWDVGVHFNLSVAPSASHTAANYFVHVGPKSRVECLIRSLKVGDAVTVVGALVQIDGKEGLIARQILDDGELVTLRDAAGRPVFRGGGTAPCD